MGKVHGRFAFLYVHFLSFILCSFCACLVVCPAALAWLLWQVRSKHVQIHVLLFFHKDETTTHLPHNMRQSMRYSYIQNWKPALTVYSNGEHLDQWRHRTTFFGQRTLYHASDVFLLFMKGVLRQKRNLFSM